MKSPVEIDAALERWWMHDGVQARSSNTYVRRGENHARAAEACFDDYQSGLYDTFAELAEGKRVVMNSLVQRYEKRTKGNRIDVYSYRLGIQRMLHEEGLG